MFIWFYMKTALTGYTQERNAPAFFSGAMAHGSRKQ